jgi:DNA modification methylase
MLHESRWPPGHTLKDHNLSTYAGNADQGPIQPVTNLPDFPNSEGRYIFSGISREAVARHPHGLHKYPAKFIPQLPSWALRYHATGQPEVVLDPFCGSGTTLVEAGLLGHRSIGYDINPLAVLISKAKTARLSISPREAEQIAIRVDSIARRRATSLARQLVPKEESLGLPETWSFWFPTRQMAHLLALRNAITEQGYTAPLTTFLLACLSAVAKGSSFLDEDQIKVRYQHLKTLADPFESFRAAAVPALLKQSAAARNYRRTKASFVVKQCSATALPLPTASVDRVVTSPPYINAVDYTMAHKYNLFLLGLVAPDGFKAHCREYIGMTERAVRAADLHSIPTTGISFIDCHIQVLWSLGTAVARNRAFIVSHYFSGMLAALEELFRVLKRRGQAIFVIGDNRVCGQLLPTAEVVHDLARKVGFTTQLRFYHHLANRSSMRLNRASSGGKVDFETVYVFQKP